MGALAVDRTISELRCFLRSLGLQSGEYVTTLDKVAADIFDDLEGNAVTRYEHGYKGYDDLVGTIGSVWKKATALFRNIAARVPAESF